MNPEILIYINKVKDYLKKNDEAYSYFLGEMDYDLFFDRLSAVAEKNYESKGDATLSKEQFEEIKTIPPKPKPNKYKENGIFLEIPNFGTICLN